MNTFKAFKFYINKFSNDLGISKAEAFNKLIEIDCFSILIKDNATELKIYYKQLLNN